MKHASGPWEIAWYECKADQNDADELNNGTKVGDVLWRLPRAIGPISASHSHWGGTLMDIEEADAHLIAAAPDLYEALERAEDLLASQGLDDEYGTVLGAVRAALNKARNEQ